MDELIKKVIAVLKAGVGTHQGRLVLAYYTGDPLLMPSNLLPAIAVSPAQSQIGTYDQARDDDRYELTVTLITDARLDFNQTPDKVASTAYLMDVMEGRKVDGTLITNSVRYLLRHDPTLGGKVYSQDGRIEYGIRQRGDAITKEAVYHLSAKRITTF